ncbi:HIBCH, partial [Symbiodinium sp. KB8]
DGARDERGLAAPPGASPDLPSSAGGFWEPAWVLATEAEPPRLPESSPPCPATELHALGGRAPDPVLVTLGGRAPALACMCEKAGATTRWCASRPPNLGEQLRAASTGPAVALQASRLRGLELIGSACGPSAGADAELRKWLHAPGRVPPRALLVPRRAKLAEQGKMQAGSATRRAISSSARAAAAAVADSGLTMAATPAGSGLVRAVLDRPKAMNALTLDMIRAMRPLVDGWTAEAGVSCVMLEGAGEKAFCAGGDIKLLHGGGQESAVKADQEAFFREEYDLDFALSRSLERGAPLVAVCDGITMGGGVGVSIHAPVRIATERYVFSMPETSIGLFPDVGGSFFLPRLPGSVGHCLALTGARVKGPEAVQLGLATHFVESGDLEALTAELAALPAGAGLAGVEEA